MIINMRKLLATFLALVFLLNATTMVFAKEPVLKDKAGSYKLEQLDNQQVRWTGRPEREEVIIGYTENLVWVEEGVYQTVEGIGIVSSDNLKGFRTIKVPIKREQWKWQWNANDKIIDSEKYTEAIEKYNKKNVDYLAGIPDELGQVLEPTFPQESSFELPLYQVETSRQLSKGEQVWETNPVIRSKVANKFGRNGDFLWVDGVSSPGIIILPRDNYDHVFIASGAYDNPKIIEIGRSPPVRPYYEIKDGKTFIYVDHFSGGGGAYGTGHQVLWFEPNYMVQGTTLPDRSVTAIDFDGTGYVSTPAVGAAPELNLTGDMTIEFWTYVTSVPDITNFIGNQRSSRWGYRIIAAVDEVTITFATNQNGAAQGTQGILGSSMVGRWVYIVVTRLGTDALIYENGVDITTAPGVHIDPLPSTTPVRFGAYSWSPTTQNLFGSMDEIRIYNRVHEQPEITYNYNNGNGTYQPYSIDGLVGWWHMDEKVGATIADYSGNGYTGTFTGGVVFSDGHVPRTTGTDGDNPGTINWGSNTGITLSYGEMTSFEDWFATTNITGGFEMTSSPMPATWFAAGGNATALPFYDSFSEVAAQTGKPVQSYYFIAIIGLAFGAFLGIVIFTRSALLAYIAMVIVFAIGSSMTIVPGWIVFVLIISGVGIMYLYKQVAY